jgi:lipopolysaccharide export system protein LptC
MRKQRTAHRWRLTLTLVIGIFIACGTFWLVQLMNRSDEEQQADKRLNEPDYIIDRFSVVRMTKAGKPSYIVSGDKLTHRPIDDASDIVKPVVRNLGTDQPPMDMRAEQGRVDQGNTRVKLQGNVQVDRAAQGKGAAMHVTTEALTIYPDDDRMETDQPVQIVQGGANAHGTGLKGNNATRQIQMQGRGSIVYPPAQHK